MHLDIRIIILWFIALAGYFILAVWLIGKITDWYRARGQATPPRPHIGFCLGEYDIEKCHDCPSHEECLELRDREQEEYPLCMGNYRQLDRSVYCDTCKLVEKCIKDTIDLFDRIKETRKNV
jgi:hypothetical protein